MAIMAIMAQTAISALPLSNRYKWYEAPTVAEATAAVTVKAKVKSAGSYDGSDGSDGS